MLPCLRLSVRAAEADIPIAMEHGQLVHPDVLNERRQAAERVPAQTHRAQQQSVAMILAQYTAQPQEVADCVVEEHHVLVFVEGVREGL